MRTKQNKGVALLWAMIVIFVVLVISGTMASIVSKESHMAMDISSSTQAYSNAKTGADWATNYVQEENLAANSPFTTTLNTSFNLDPTGPTTSNVTIKITPTAGTGYPYTVSSTGKYGSVKRKIEHVISNATPGVNLVPPNGYLSNPTGSGLLSYPVGHTITDNNGSFELQFDFWYTGNTQFSFGLKGPIASSGKLIMNGNTATNTYTLTGTANGGSNTLSSLNTIIAPDNTQTGTPYQFRATIRYSKSTGATLIIKQILDRTASSSSYECLGITYIDRNGIDLGNLTNFAITLKPGGDAHYRSLGPISDGTYLQLEDTSGLNNVYIDNIIIRGITPSGGTGAIPAATSDPGNPG